MIETILTTPTQAEHALTSIPWPADRLDMPAVEGVASQVVSLFDPKLTPRLRRYLLLNHRVGGLPRELKIVARAPQAALASNFSDCTIHTLKEALDSKEYVYREG